MPLAPLSPLALLGPYLQYPRFHVFILRNRGYGVVGSDMLSEFLNVLLMGQGIGLFALFERVHRSISGVFQRSDWVGLGWVSVAAAVYDTLQLPPFHSMTLLLRGSCYYVRNVGCCLAFFPLDFARVTLQILCFCRVMLVRRGVDWNTFNNCVWREGFVVWQVYVQFMYRHLLSMLFLLLK